MIAVALILTIVYTTPSSIHVFVLQIVKSYDITDAAAYLLEQNDNIQGAYEVLFAVS